MKHCTSTNLNRRQLLSRVPAGVAFCLGCSQGWAQAVSKPPERSQADANTFDREMPPMTYLQWARNRHSKYIGILTQMKEELGSQRLLELLKNASYAENVALGKRLSHRIDSMHTFAGPFRDTESRVGQTIVRDIVEDNENVFEMRITECLTEKVFREAGALDLGYACVCHADFGLPEGMDINIKLERSKTLMQGHACCNHRYVLLS